MKHEGSTFLSGVAISSNFFFFSKELDEFSENEIPNSSFFVYDEDDQEKPFRKARENVHWPAISMATTKPSGGKRTVVAIGPNGDFWELFPWSLNEVVGRIDLGRLTLRKLAAVDDEIYACGMGRQVLRRNDTAQWSSIGPGSLAGDPPVIGFEDLDGYGANEIYSVGWGGEIWWFDHNLWRRVDSPTNSNLSSLTCAPDGMVYVVGHDGTLLRGRYDHWTTIETKRRDNLRDVGTHEGQVFVVTDFEILRLVDDDLLPETDFSDVNDLPMTCLHLLKGSDGLVSLGQKDVFIKRDGPWRRLV